MIVQLNIFPPHCRPQSLEDLNSLTSQGLVIEPGAQNMKGVMLQLFFLIALSVWLQWLKKLSAYLHILY